MLLGQEVGRLRYTFEVGYMGRGKKTEAKCMMAETNVIRELCYSRTSIPNQLGPTDREDPNCPLLR
jgi:hypothetical protein